MRGYGRERDKKGKECLLEASVRDGSRLHAVANQSQRSGAHLLPEGNRKKRTTCTSMPPRTSCFTVCFVVCFHELVFFFFLLNSFCLSAPGASVYCRLVPRLFFFFFLRRFLRTFYEDRQCMQSASQMLFFFFLFSEGK